MTPKLWFIKNMTHEAAGLLSSFADREKVPYAIADLHQGDAFPEVSPGQAVVLLGGPDSANDVAPKILSELFAIRKCLREGIPDACKIFQLHGETVGLTQAMNCLARGRFCENQVVKIQPRAYGIQGHVELSEPMFEAWLAEDGDLSRMNIEELRRDFSLARQELERNSEAIFKNFLRISNVMR